MIPNPPTMKVPARLRSVDAAMPPSYQFVLVRRNTLALGGAQLPPSPQESSSPVKPWNFQLHHYRKSGFASMRRAIAPRASPPPLRFLIRQRLPPIGSEAFKSSQ